MSIKQKSVEVFCCYARKDAPFLPELKAHLTPLQREGLITIWTDIDIEAGHEWQHEIAYHLNTAPIILLLVSPDFMVSDYCYSIEMQIAMERHERGEAQVIPIILRPTDWETAPFGKLQALPKNATPVTSQTWHTKDEALLSVATGIRATLQTRATEEERQRQVEGERQRQLALQAETEEKERQKEQQLAKSKYYKYYKFRHNEIYASTFAVLNAEIFLLAGMGTLIGILTQRWLWAVGTVVVFFALAYPAYRKAIPLLFLSIIGMISGAFACWITILISPAHYDMVITNNFLFNITGTITFRHQIIAGICIGAIFSLPGFYVLDSSKKTSFDTNLYAGAILLGIGSGSVVWLIVNLLASIFNWGFGFASGWYLNFFGGYLVTACAGIGIICLYYFWSRIQSQVVQLAEESRHE